MRAVRRRSASKAPPVPVARQLSVSHPHHSGNGASVVSVPYASTSSRLGMPLRAIDESVFSPGGQDTKLVSLSHLNLTTTNNTEYGRASTYAPSISTTGAGHGHDMDDASRRGASPEPGYTGNGIGGTHSSQGRDPHSIKTAGNGVKAAPVGYTKPSASSKGAGFLARISSRRTKQSGTEQLTPVSDLSQGMGASTESFNYEQESRGPAFAHDYATGAVTRFISVSSAFGELMFIVTLAAQSRPCCQLSFLSAHPSVFPAAGPQLAKRYSRPALAHLYCPRQ